MNYLSYLAECSVLKYRILQETLIRYIPLKHLKQEIMKSREKFQGKNLEELKFEGLSETLIKRIA